MSILYYLIEAIHLHGTTLKDCHWKMTLMSHYYSTQINGLPNIFTTKLIQNAKHTPQPINVFHDCEISLNYFVSVC